MIFGYARISTLKQSIERQLRNIKTQYPDAVIISEKYTGTKMDRPEWSKLYKKAKSGDLIVFDSVSRMSRNADEGFETYETLFKRGVELVFLKERHIDTSVYKKALEGQLQLAVNTGDNKTDDLIAAISKAINDYLLALAKEQIRLAFEQSEKEVADLRQRTREGIETARLAGKQIGQKQGKKLEVKKEKALKKLIRKYSRAFDGSCTDQEVISIINGLDKIAYGTKTVKRTNPDTGKQEEITEELCIKPLEGLTKAGNQRSRFLNKSTYFKYKKELYNEQDKES